MPGVQRESLGLVSAISKSYPVTRITPFRLRHLATARLASSARHMPVLGPRLVERFASDLRCLHDALERTGLEGHYWMWAGLLLGWAREGAILPHDSLDADFAVADHDFHRLVSAVPAILEAGFSCDRRFVNNAGELTELTFRRHGARFDFFKMFSAGDCFRYFLYSLKWNRTIELEASIPRQPKVPFAFIDRTWLKHEDHELELRAIYGSWEIPDPSWSYLDGLAIQDRRVSRHNSFDWRGGAD
jgi:hypothetical protein